MILINFTVHGQPVPKQSFRVGQTGGYIDEKVTQWQENVGWEALAARQRRELELLKGPVKVWLEFYMATDRKVDVDNLAKAVLDSCNGVLWEDDRQVVNLHILKRTSKCPRAEVTVQELTEADLHELREA